MIHPKKTLVTLFLIIALSIFSLPLNASADTQVTLQWDANDPAPAGYRVYGRAAGDSYNYDEPWWEGDYSFTQCTIDQLDENTTYYFVVRAYDAEDNESGDSNEVAFNAGASNDGAGLVSNSAGSSGGGMGCFLDTLIHSH